MKLKEKLVELHAAIDNKFEQQFGFKLHEVTLSKIVYYMYKPKDSSSLAVTRILFGLAMLFDIPDERGGAAMAERWGNPDLCHFPLLPWLRPLPMPHMALVYAALWLGALGIMLGYKYKTAAVVFTLCHWYLLLIEKSYWNNHSYLFGLVAALLTCIEANCYWSLDAYLDPKLKKEVVPYWNYFVLKYQFFILYFMAGVKKSGREWLAGYSVEDLSEHWVFDPFKIFLTPWQINLFIVHWFIFLFDLTVAFWMMWGRTRHVAMIFCAMFHLMNSRLFKIGMFPWVCLATMPLFYQFDWPKVVMKRLNNYILTVRKKICCSLERPKYMTSETIKNASNITKEDNLQNTQEIETINTIESDGERKSNSEINEHNQELLKTFLDKPKEDNVTEVSAVRFSSNNEKENFNTFTVYIIILYVATQAFLPFSHFITKGYNNWTNGLYGYSWDMMVHTWDPHTVIVQVVDNERNEVLFVDPHKFTPNERWSRHGDMVYQYAHWLKVKILELSRKQKGPKISSNISIYIDVWCSLNGRFIQRMFDPKVDLLTTTWSPLKSSPYLMPILDESIHWRNVLDNYRKNVHSWSKYSDVTFYADFPGYHAEKFISSDLQNVTLIVLQGLIAYELEDTSLCQGHTVKVEEMHNISVESGRFHKVRNIGNTPAFYMYTFFNSTEAKVGRDQENKPNHKLPIGSELARRAKDMFKFGNIVLSSIFQIFFQVSTCSV